MSTSVGVKAVPQNGVFDLLGFGQFELVDGLQNLHPVFGVCLCGEIIKELVIHYVTLSGFSHTKYDTFKDLHKYSSGFG